MKNLKLKKQQILSKIRSLYQLSDEITDSIADLESCLYVEEDILDNVRTSTIKTTYGDKIDKEKMSDMHKQMIKDYINESFQYDIIAKMNEHLIPIISTSDKYCEVDIFSDRIKPKVC